MMKVLASAVLVAFFLVGNANAGVTTLQAQYNTPAGFTEQISQQCAGGNFVSAAECVTLPAGQQIVGFAGTMTAKYANIEILAQIWCNGEVLWQGEMLGGPVTKMIESPPSLYRLTDAAFQGGGTCWIQYQVGNSGGTPPNPGWEIQFNIYTAPPEAN
jgi:hypothetical protein